MLVFEQDFTTRQYMITPDFEYFHYRDNSTMEVDYHNHDFYEIYFYFSGNITYLIEGKSYKLKPGDILLIHNKELHKPIIESVEDTYERVVLWVNPEFLERYSMGNTNLLMSIESSFKDNYNLLRPEPEMLEIIKEILHKFEMACNSISFGSDVLKNIYIIELLVYINKAFLETYDNTIDKDIEYNEKISRVIEYINENLSSKMSLDSLSSTFFLSKYHLLREFKKYTGYTIHEYIRQKRLIMAKSLLKEGIQVTEVCSMCGFGDYSNFIRSFKKAYGLAPKKYCKKYFK